MVAGKESNFQSFLNETTPVVPSKFLLQSEIGKLNKLWNPWNPGEDVEFFRLSDLWDIIAYWSAYGVGVPIKMKDNGEPCDQYFVPYLSAIQIFIDSSSMITHDNNITIRGRGGGEIDQWVGGEGLTRDSLLSSESTSDLSDNFSENVSRWECGSSEVEENWHDDVMKNNDDKLGTLYFQYFEKASHFSRIPLMDKIDKLSESYPGLMTLRNVDLSPSSWIAIAWYPLYHIPVRTTNPLQTCFLNYYTLSSSFQEKKENEGGQGGDGIRLAPFGAASYKLNEEVWISRSTTELSSHDDEDEESRRLSTYLSVADCWLKQLNVHHPDYNYYLRIP